ncbi:sigma-70 family RNA polymerase sigma factor [Halalkalibaculum sp. DA3122]|uniref:sigma-70 family RNA polymerase sigma factor n=1 Tax=Halalkalibaculum sp. DA3122 TaxID=3373607 RepID=UPI0037546D0B
MIVFNFIAVLGAFSHRDSGDERALVKRIKGGDTKALEELYELYKSLLFGMILSIVKKREEAEDLLQEVFMKIWEKAHTFDEERGNVYSWIVTITRNKSIDRIRSKGYKTQQKTSTSVNEPALTLEGDNFDPLETTIFSDRSELVKRALEKIPEEQREVIKVAYYGGMTQSEIAEHLDIPLGTVKTRTRQGMIKLKNILEDHISIDG